MSTNPFTYTAFADWCDKQGHQQYEWSSCCGCACGQYARTLGIYNWYVSPSKFWLRANQLAYDSPRTFDALADRLRTFAKYEAEGAAYV